MKKLWRIQLDLQAKISLILVAVIVPMFLIVTVAENQFAFPILEEEIRQIGIHAGKTLATEIDSSRVLTRTNPTPAIENLIQEYLYTQPNIVRIDVIVKDNTSLLPKIVGSSAEDDPNIPLPIFPLVDTITSEFREDQAAGVGLWEINVPIEHKSRDPKAPKKLLGSIHVVVSTKMIGKIVNIFWKTTATAAAFSVVSLIFLLSYFLRKTLANDRLLRRAESQNLQLTEQLHETQRQLMNTEKLAVMGQLTASFAHEIGTPLNAIGGHLQLLQEELTGTQGDGVQERFEVVNSQLKKIEQIVKSFLQSTAKPSSQKQLVDINRLADKTLGIVGPRIDSMGVEVKRVFDRGMGPIRVVPLDLEQVLLNLLNNSLDSLQAKQNVQGIKDRKRQLELSTQVAEADGKAWAQISVYDTGEGIRRGDLQNVLKPFFTTKRPGEGTGLGLTICQQLVRKYGGDLLLDSKEGAWTRVTLRMPYYN